MKNLNVVLDNRKEATESNSNNQLALGNLGHDTYRGDSKKKIKKYRITPESLTQRSNDHEKTN